jgi:hypothetical protein
LSPDGELGEKTGLAYPRVAGDESDRAPALLGPLEEVRQPAEFLGPADEGGAGCDRDARKYRALGAEACSSYLAPGLNPPASA